MANPQRFVARTVLPVSADEAFAWHERPGAFERLSPPWEPLEVLERSPGLAVGARTRVRMSMGELLAVHTAYEPGRMFRDEQEKGFFARWVHTHRFIPSADGTSTMEDEVEYELPFGPLGALGGSAMARRRLEALFAYRHRVLSRDLVRHRRFAGQPRLRIAMTGASGFLGSALAAYLTTAGHRVVPLVRRAAGEGEIRWDPPQGAVDLAALEGVDAVIHLAGASVAQSRWSEERKREILESRTLGTAAIARACASLSRKPTVFISTSAVGYYGDRGDGWLTEESAPGDDFLASVCKAWEAAAQPAEDRGIRVVHPRIGVALSPAGGALQKLLLPFKLGAGGPQGTGQQWMSWISLEDVLGLFEHALHDERITGAMNAVAPNPVRNAEFARTLGHVLRRPAVAPLPAFAISAAFGEMGRSVLLASQRVKPTQAERRGFEFEYAELEPALRMLLGKDKLRGA